MLDPDEGRIFVPRLIVATANLEVLLSSEVVSDAVWVCVDGLLTGLPAGRADFAHVSRSVLERLHETNGCSREKRTEDAGAW